MGLAGSQCPMTKDGRQQERHGSLLLVRTKMHSHKKISSFNNISEWPGNGWQMAQHLFFEIKLIQERMQCSKTNMLPATVPSLSQTKQTEAEK